MKKRTVHLTGKSMLSGTTKSSELIAIVIQYGGGNFISILIIRRHIVVIIAKVTVQIDAQIDIPFCRFSISFTKFRLDLKYKIATIIYYKYYRQYLARDRCISLLFPA